MLGKNERRTILVKRELQFKFAFIVFAAMVLSAFIIGWDIYFWAVDYLIETETPYLTETLYGVIKLLLYKFVLLIIALVIISIFFSHRIVGPLFRFEKEALKRVAEGDLTYRLSFRKHDELSWLASSFNRMTESLQAKAMEDRKKIREIEDVMENLAERLKKTGLDVEAKELEDLRHKLSYFGVVFTHQKNLHLPR